jgi:hypothetical protein
MDDLDWEFGVPSPPRPGGVVTFTRDEPIIDGINQPPAEQTDAQNERIQNDDYSDLEEDAQNKKPGD